MRLLQGASLLVYNNAEFSEENWKSISNVAARAKADDRTQIGKFGIGFISVYNVTDSPIIYSGEKVIIVDNAFIL